MKIAIFVQEMTVGGVSTFILNLSRLLYHAGHDVTVITLDKGEWGTQLTEIGVKVHCLKPKSWTVMRYQASRLADYLSEQQFDLFMVNLGGQRLPMVALHYLCDRLPILVALHGDQPVVYDLATVNLTTWNCAVGVSPKVQQVAAARLNPKPVHCILYGIDLPTPKQLATRQSWALPLRLLFVGRLYDCEKGIFRLPAIVAGCRAKKLAVRLTVIGDGPDYTHLSRLFVEQGVADWVEMQGFQANTVVTEQMRSHHLLLLPSNTEALGIVVQEAQANGCVPIASRMAGVTDITIADGLTGRLVEATDIAGFVAAIATFTSAEVWTAYSQAAIAHAHQTYGLEIMRDRYLTLFAELHQGAYPLPLARSTFRQQGGSPFTWADYLPALLRSALSKTVQRVRRLARFPALP
jgi:glycosyltransferase involved in cell wall biosynthesis